MNADSAVFSEIPAWRRHLAAAMVILMPVSLNAEKLTGAKSRTYFSPLDVLLPVLFLGLLADVLRRRPWVRASVPPVPVLLWAGLALVSWFWTDSFPNAGPLKAWIKGPFFFGVAAVWVFQNAAGSAAEFRRLLLLFGASFSLCVLWALKQYAEPPGLPFDPEQPQRLLGGATNVRVAGWYEFREVFGAQAAMTVPAAVALALMEKDAALRWAAGAFAAVALCVTLSAGGFLGACAGAAAVIGAYALRRSWLTALTALAIVVLLLGSVLPRLPRQNLDVIRRNASLFALDGGKMKATARARRCQAELDLLVSRPPGQSAPLWQKGAGLDQFQGQVRRFYDQEYKVYPKPSYRTDDEAAFGMEADEPFSFGFFETVAVELGVPGLAAVLLIFAVWIFSAYGGFAAATAGGADSGARATLALAALGAGCGACVLSVFSNPVIRGAGGTWALFFALALAVRTPDDRV